MIPTPVINHFLKDLEDGTVNGFPSLGIEFSKAESRALRQYYKIDGQEGGIVVTRVYPNSAVNGLIKEGDIIMKISGTPISEDGTFKFRDNERLFLSYLIDRHQEGESVRIDLIRGGHPKEVNATFKPFVNLVAQTNYFRKPPYYIYGGFIFTVLSVDLLQEWGNRWWEQSPIDFAKYLLGTERLNLSGKKEIVVLLDVLPDDVNVGYHDLSKEVITKVNGKDFRSFKEFVKLLENNDDQYTIIETANNTKVILNRQDIEESTARILDRNSIPAQFSADVAEYLKK